MDITMVFMQEELLYFSNKLKELRAKRNCSKYQVAKETGVQPRQYGRYEDGETAPTLPVLVKLAHFFEVSIDELVTEDSINTEKIEDKTLLGYMLRVDKLDYQAKYIVKEMLESVLHRHEVGEQKAG